MDLRKRSILVAALLLAGTGCVEFWSKDGIVQEAIEKDSKENLPKPACSNGKPRQRICPDPAKPDRCSWECPN